MLCIAVTTAGVLFILQFGVLWNFLASGFLRVEEREVGINVNRAVEAVRKDVDSLSQQLLVWSSWDETYDFAATGNPFFRKYIADYNMEALHINTMQFLNAKGEIIGELSYDLTTHAVASTAAGLRMHLGSGSPLLTFSDLKDHHEGLLLLPEGPVMIATRPILTSKSEGPSRGTLVFVRNLTDAEVQSLAGLTHTTLVINPVGQPSVHTSSIGKGIVFSSGDTSVIPISNSTITGYTTLTDIHGNPAVSLHVTGPRPIYTQALESYRYLVISLLILVVVGLFLAMFILDRLILSRIVRLTGAVADIGKQGDMNKRIASDPRKDEISTLASSINHMLDGLEYSHYAYTHSASSVPATATGEVILLVLSDDGTVKLINNKGSEMLGYEMQEIVGKNWFDSFVPTYYRERLRDAFQAFLTGDTSFSLFDNPVLKKNGEERHILWHNELLKDDTGRIIGVSSSGEDITGRQPPGLTGNGAGSAA